MIEIRDLVGGWGESVVIDSLSLTVEPSEVVGIIGRNGVGKSTLLELIVGRAQRHSGEVRLGGQDVARLSIHDRSLAGIGYVPQQREVFPSLTVAEHLSISTRPGKWTKSVVEELFPSLAARRNSLGRHLSGGEQQMLAIARALLTNPSVLLLDEPSEGLAPVVVEHLVEAIRRMAGADSLSILLVEQRVDIAVDLCTRCIVMDRGRIVREADSASLRENSHEFASLLGLEH